MVHNARRLLARSERKASLSPDGNQLAWLSVAGLFVSWTRFCPLASETQMSALVPGRHRLSANFWPSGEKRPRLLLRLVSGEKAASGPVGSEFCGDIGTVQRLLWIRFAL